MAYIEDNEDDEKDESSEDSEDVEEAGEQEELENIIEASAIPSRRTIQKTNPINPFLEQAPIENLEQDLESLNPPQTEEEIPAQNVYNAPDYSYNTNAYRENQRQREIETGIAQEAIKPFEPTFAPSPTQTRAIDIESWQRQNIGMDRQRQEEYYTPPKPAAEDKLPFQQKKKLKRL